MQGIMTVHIQYGPVFCRTVYGGYGQAVNQIKKLPHLSVLFCPRTGRESSALLGTGLVNDVGSAMITWMLLGGSEASEW
jgi:hypothetical protein